MDAEGPLLESLTRRLAETPPDFLAEPVVGSAGTVHTAAVVSDLLVDLGGAPLDTARAAAFTGRKVKPAQLRLVQIAAWLLADPWFASAGGFAGDAEKLLAGGLEALASLIDPTRFVSEPDRREELARVVLRGLGLRPAGETVAAAADRLATLDTVERRRVIAEAKAAEERARKVREEMARKAAAEAAARYSPE